MMSERGPQSYTEHLHLDVLRGPKRDELRISIHFSISPLTFYLFTLKSTTINTASSLPFYLCMVITFSTVWINRVRLPILLVVS